MLPDFLLPPFIQQARVREAANEEKRKKEAFEATRSNPTVWVENKPPRAKGLIVLEASSWMKSVEPFLIPGLGTVDRRTIDDWKEVQPEDLVLEKDQPNSLRGMVFRHQLLPAGVTVRYKAPGMKSTDLAFTEDIVIPTLFHSYGQRLQGVWMSITPMEIATQQPGVKFASGNVLVGGLGLGWMAQRIAEKRSVTAVTVVEEDKSVIDFITPRLTSQKITVVHECVYRYLTEKRVAKFNRIVLDVWSRYGESKHDYRLRQQFSWPHEKNRKKLWCWGGKPREGLY